MVIKHFKLSQPEKERLIRIKSRTGIQNWNILCRWAFCWSLAEPSAPGGIDPKSDSNVEMDWTTFAGEYADIYEALLRQRCVNDGVGDSDEALIKFFRLHLNRGINHYSGKDVLKNCADLLQSALPKGGRLMAIYLDYNASAPIDSRVLNYMIEIYRTHWGNADSRTHVFGTEAKELVNNSRRTIAELLGVDSTDLFFTSGSTESNNMAVLGLLEFALASGRNHFITTAIEHKSVIESMHFLQSHGCKVDFVSPNFSGRVEPEQILERVTDKTLLVSIMHVNSETGIIQPIRAIGDALSDSPVYFHVDATQSFGKLNKELHQVKYDMLSVTAHKLGGPQGIGALVLRRDGRYQRPPVKPLMYGGQQERGFRPGTTPVALVAGFALAAQLSDNEANQHMKICKKIKEQFFDEITGLDYALNGAPQFCLPTTVNISFSGVDAEGLFLALKDEYAFSNGSACNSGSHSPSYVLSAMGLSEQRINEAIRISWSGKTQVSFLPLVKYIQSAI